MIPEHRLALHPPSEWDVVLSPELAPLFVLDAAIVAAQRIFSGSLDPSSLHPGGARYPPTLALLQAMRSLRCHIREHRRAEQALASGRDREGDVLEDEVHDEETEPFPF